MKAIIELDLTNDEDLLSYKRLRYLDIMTEAIVELRNYMRQQRKYGDPPDSFGAIDEKITKIFSEVPSEL